MDIMIVSMIVIISCFGVGVAVGYLITKALS